MEFFPPQSHQSTSLHCHVGYLSYLHATLHPTRTYNQMKKVFQIPDESCGPCGVTGRMLQAGDAAEFQALLLYFSMAYGKPTCNLQTGNSPSYNPSTKALTRIRLNLPLTGEYIWMTHWPSPLKVFSSLDSTHTKLNNTLVSNELRSKPYIHTDTWRYLLSTMLSTLSSLSRYLRSPLHHPIQQTTAKIHRNSYVAQDSL